MSFIKKHYFKLNIKGPGYSLLTKSDDAEIVSHPLDLETIDIPDNYINIQKTVDYCLDNGKIYFTISIEKELRKNPIVAYGCKTDTRDEFGREGIKFIHSIEFNDSSLLYGVVLNIARLFAQSSVGSLIERIGQVATGKIDQKAITDFVIAKIERGIGTLDVDSDIKELNFNLIKHDCSGAPTIAWLTFASFLTSKDGKWKVADSYNLNLRSIVTTLICDGVENHMVDASKILSKGIFSIYDKQVLLQVNSEPKHNSGLPDINIEKEPVDGRAEFEEKSDVKVGLREKADVRAEFEEKSDVRAEFEEKSNVKVEFGEKADVRAEFEEKSNVKVEFGEKADVRAEFEEKSDGRAEFEGKSDGRTKFGEKFDGRTGFDEKPVGITEFEGMPVGETESEGKSVGGTETDETKSEYKPPIATNSKPPRKTTDLGRLTAKASIAFFILLFFLSVILNYWLWTKPSNKMGRDQRRDSLMKNQKADTTDNMQELKSLRSQLKQNNHLIIENSRLYYLVLSDESVKKIAERCGISERVLKHSNPIDTKDSLIKEGVKLLIIKIAPSATR